MRARSRPWLPIGIGAAVVGLLPWLVHGMRLPLQNLWAGAVSEQTSPLLLLPFSQYAVTTIAALLIEGGAVAGLVGLLVPGARTRGQRALLVVGVVLVQGVAIAQTAATVAGGLRPGTEARIYLGLLVAGSVLALLIGVAVAVLVSSPAPAAVVVGAGLAAPLAAEWAGAVVFAPFSIEYGMEWVGAILRWLPAVVVGSAIARAGLGTLGRIAAAVFALLALWLGSALTTAIANAVGTRAYARAPAEMAQYGLEVFRSALGAVDIVLPAVLGAVVVAGAGMLVLRRRAAVASR